MPTFLLMKEGTTVDKLVGANPDEMRKRISDFVKSIGSDKTSWIKVVMLTLLFYNKTASVVKIKYDFEINPPFVYDSCLLNL